MDTRIELGSIYGAHTRQGLVEMTVSRDDQTIKVQMDLDKAREVSGMLLGAIEAAVSDGLLMHFLTSHKIGLSELQAGRALLDFRELRQGTRETVWPS
jgi:hypothetical protein